MCAIGAIINHAGEDPKIVRGVVAALLASMIERGTDAAGIAAYKSPEKVWIRKEPIDGVRFAEKLLQIRGWEEARIILLHTRAYTSCPPAYNFCNHPLFEEAGNRVVSLVHNGIITDVKETRHARLAVDSDALLNPVRRRGKLDFDTVKEMALIRGSKAILVTDGETVYAYRDTNPLCYANTGRLLIFASTANMVREALRAAGAKASIVATETYTIYRVDLEAAKITKKKLARLTSDAVGRSCETERGRDDYWESFRYYDYYYDYDPGPARIRV